MIGLMTRAEAIARSAQQRRLEQLASAMRAIGVSADVASDSILCRGKRLVARWLSDPAFRFAARSGS